MSGVDDVSNQSWLVSVTASAAWFKKRALASNLQPKRHRGLLVWLVDVRIYAHPSGETRTIGVQSHGVPRLLQREEAGTGWVRLSGSSLAAIRCSAPASQVRQDFARSLPVAR